MNRLIMAAVTCLFGFLLVACGESGTSKPVTAPAKSSEAPAEQNVEPQQNTNKSENNQGQ